MKNLPQEPALLSLILSRPFIRILMKGYAPCLSKSKAIGNKQQSSEAIA